MVFKINRYKDEVLIDEDKIIFKTRESLIEKDIKDIIKTQENIVYGGIFYLLFGPRVSENPKFSNAGYKSISMKFFFEDKQFLTIPFSVGDDFMVERSLENIKEINRLLTSEKPSIKLEKTSDFKYF